MDPNQPAPEEQSNLDLHCQKGFLNLLADNKSLGQKQMTFVLIGALRLGQKFCIS